MAKRKREAEDSAEVEDVAQLTSSMEASLNDEKKKKKRRKEKSDSSKDAAQPASSPLKKEKKEESSGKKDKKDKKEKKERSDRKRRKSGSKDDRASLPGAIQGGNDAAVDFNGTPELASAPTESDSKKKKKKEKSSHKKDRKDKEKSGKKDRRKSDARDVNTLELKDGNDAVKKDGMTVDATDLIQTSPLVADEGGKDVVDLNGTPEPTSAPAENDSKKKKKKEKSGHKKDRKVKKESGKKKRPKFEADDANTVEPRDGNEGAKKDNTTADGTHLIQSVVGATAMAVDHSVENNAKQSSKKSRRSGDKTHSSKEAEEGRPATLYDDQHASETGRGDECGPAELPTVQEILEKAKKKHNAFLHGYAVVPLLLPEQVKALDEESQGKVIGSTAGLCERLMHLMHDTITTANRWTKPDVKDDATAMEESVVNDMMRLKKVPLAKQYIEMTLWRRIAQLNRDLLLAASRLGFGKGLSDNSARGQGKQGLLLHCENDPDAEFVSYREAHMKTIVEQYSESLEKMREAESMDADRVHFLLRCLDSGASLFGNLKCLEKKESDNNNSLN